MCIFYQTIRISGLYMCFYVYRPLVLRFWCGFALKSLRLTVYLYLVLQMRVLVPCSVSRCLRLAND